MRYVSSLVFEDCYSLVAVRFLVGKISVKRLVEYCVILLVHIVTVSSVAFK